jgi:hypothetical protein
VKHDLPAFSFVVSLEEVVVETGQSLGNNTNKCQLFVLVLQILNTFNPTLFVEPPRPTLLLLYPPVFEAIASSRLVTPILYLRLILLEHR